MTEQAVWRIVSRSVFLVLGLILLVLLVRELRSVIVQLLVAVLLAAAATPVVDRLTLHSSATRRHWRPGRSLVVILVFFGAALLLAVGAVAIVAAVLPDLAGLAVSLPRYAAMVRHAIDDVLAANPELAARLSPAVPSLANVAGGPVGMLGQAPRLVAIVTGFLSGSLYVLVTLVLGLYLTIDGDRIRRYAIEFLPFDRHDQALEVTERIGMRLGAWARGEALLAVIIGGMTWVGALLIGVPYAAALALIAGVGEIVPNVGPIVAAIPLIILGLLSSPTQGLLALIVAVAIQQLENNLIVPRVMGQAVDLHPVAVMLAILAGGVLLGIPGALVAVPAVASLSVAVDEFQRERVARRRARLTTVLSHDMEDRDELASSA